MGIDPLIPLELAAAWLATSPQVLSDMLRNGEMPYHEVGMGKERKRIRIKQSELLKYIDKTEVKPIQKRSVNAA